MRYLQNIVYFLVFVILFLFALRNTQSVTLGFYILRLYAPLVVLIMCTFILGGIIGFLFAAPKIYRLKQVIKSLKQGQSDINASLDVSAYPQTKATSVDGIHKDQT